MLDAPTKKERVAKLLQQQPMTTTEIAKALGWTRPQAANVVNSLNQDVTITLHVADYVKPTGAHCHERVWGWGAGQDAIHPLLRPAVEQNWKNLQQCFYGSRTESVFANV